MMVIVDQIMAQDVTTAKNNSTLKMYKVIKLMKKGIVDYFLDSRFKNMMEYADLVMDHVAHNVSLHGTLKISDFVYIYFLSNYISIKKSK